MQKKQLYGLIGFPVGHSLSPVMQDAAFKYHRIDAEYRLFEVKPENLESFLTKEVFELNLSGFNITIPHKVKAREILEKSFPNQEKQMQPQIKYYVKTSGAVNTVKRSADKLEYFNTDASGFLRALGESLKFDPSGKEALLIGCGGAGRAIIAALSWKKSACSKIYIYDIDDQSVNSAKEHFLSKSPHADFLPDKLQFIQKEDLEKVIKGCSLLVNASPIGMKNPKESPIDKNILHQGLNVFDVVYNKEGKTQLIKDAVAQAAGGLEMLLYQGADAFNMWTGKKAPIEEMRKALNEGASLL